VEFAPIGVVGLGTMGAGIAEVAARSGVPVVAVEVNDTAMSAGRQRLEGSLDRAVQRGRLDPLERDAILGRFTFTTNRADLAVTGIVVEAIPERLELKTELFAELDGICPVETIFATNTSSLPVTAIAAATGRPDRVVGMHFFNPAPVMRLVEVVRTVVAEDAAVTRVAALAMHCGKTPVVVGDRAGFIANALLFGYLNDAARMVERQHASMTALDAALMAAAGFPMGPITLMDLIGLDVCLEVLEVMYAETRDARYAASPLLRRLVLAGRLGRKTGRGYYDYSGDNPQPAVTFTVSEPVATRERGESSYIVESLLYPHLDDAVRMLDDNYATAEEIDTAMQLGCGYPRGPFALLSDVGVGVVAEGLQRHGRVPSPLLTQL
jgi:3-hydroxybutyryl-CoA dehydrogenase